MFNTHHIDRPLYNAYMTSLQRYSHSVYNTYIIYISKIYLLTYIMFNTSHVIKTTINILVYRQLPNV